MKLMAGWEGRRGGSQLLRSQDRKSGCSSHGCGQGGSRNLKCLGLDVVSHGSGGGKGERRLTACYTKRYVAECGLDR